MPKKNRRPKSKKQLIDLNDPDTALSHYQSNPLEYCGDVLGIEMTWKLQRDMLDACLVALKERRHIYVASGHSLGKDYICAAIGLWFLQTHVPSNVILTGPTDRQVKNVMWKETLSHWNNKKIDYGGRAFTEPKILITPDWYLIGFTTKETGATKEGGGGKFQGYHSPNVCVIVTEAQAIEDNIYDQIDAITTNKNILVIFIGNPTRAKGRFAKGLKDRRTNIVLNFSCLENPNYIQRKEVIPGLASYEWVEAMRAKWGESDPRWIGRVLGQVPDQSLNNIFTDQVIEHAKSRFGFIARHSFNRGVAWDPAGEGADDHVMTGGSEGEVMEKFKKTLLSPTEGAICCVQMCKRISGSWIIVDCDGSGARDFAALKELPREFRSVNGQEIQLIAFHGSAPPNEIVTIQAGGHQVTKTLYLNCRTAASFITKDRIMAGKASIDPSDKDLIEDLQEDCWIPDKTPLQIIPKDEVKEVLGRSPGDGDSYKMFQFACELNLKQLSYSGNSSMPQYGNISDDLYRQTRGLPTHGITS
jgi:hypothetical protein